MVPTASMPKFEPVASKLCGAGPSLEYRRIVMQHGFADHLDRCKTLAHEIVVKALQRERGAFTFLQVGSQFHDLQLAERVVEIERIRSATLGLDLCDGPRLIALIDEEVFGLRDGQFAANACVHSDGDDKSRVTK